MKRILFFLFLTLPLLSANAIVISVPEDYPTIQEAVDNAVSGDEIRVSPGIYGPVYIEEFDDLKLIGSGIVPPNVTVIDVDDSCRGIEVQSCTKIIIQGFEIRDCWQECLHFLDCAEVYALDNYLHDCTDNLGNGLAITRCDNVLIKRNVIVENTEVGLYIDALYNPDSTSTDVRVINNTIGYTGEGSWGADGLTQSWSDTGFVYKNNINAFNSDYGLHYKFGFQTNLSELQYNCHYGNLFGPWGSCIGDSTNIYVDPLFTPGPGIYAYFLSDHSPCIDAGDPDMLDPDSTRSDIGALYYNQGLPGELEIELTPEFSPIIIPPEGGHFPFRVHIVNNSNVTQYFDVWLNMTLPTGLVMGPLMIRNNLCLDSHESIAGRMSLDVSPIAMPGEYHLVGHVGYYPTTYIVDSDSFAFEKEAFDGFIAGGNNEWRLSGWGEDETFTVDCDIKTFELVELSAYPNPFNPQTTISYTIPYYGMVTVQVYNTLGQEVGTLYSGMADAGEHRQVLDGSNLVSGMYLTRVTYNDKHYIERVLLVK